VHHIASVALVNGSQSLHTTLLGGGESELVPFLTTAQPEA